MPMLLKGEDGKELEIALIGDRLPEVLDGFGDDETAQLSFRVATDDVEWEETAPLLALHELHALADWLEGLSVGGAAGEAEIEVLEAGLGFMVVKQLPDKIHLRVRFELKDRPEEFAVDAETTEASHIDLKLPHDAFKIAAAQLRSDIAAIETSPKDDLRGEEDLGMIAAPDPTLGLIDSESDEAPGAGDGEDNAGDR